MSSVIRLTLSDFRCYARLRLEVDPRPVVLTGPNGAGKTNLIEAVSFLVPGRGLRRARLNEIGRREGGPAAGWAVAATVRTPAGPVEIGTGLEPGSERRVVRIDGQPAASQSALAEFASVVWLTPAMDRLFQEGPAARRQFLDRLVFGFDPAHAGRVAAYEHALRERSRLLRDGRGDAGWLGALEETMAEKGVAVAAARREMVARLARGCAEAEDSAFPRAAPMVAGTVEAWLAEMPAVEAEERLRRLLQAARGEDALSGGGADGPHRSDLAVTHVAKSLPAAQCSTGEQKALLIGLVLAQTRVQAAAHGTAPILLLDEVVAHLDERRREALFDALCAQGGQAWLTGTDRALFAGLAGRAQFMTVEDAAVTADAN